MNLPAASLSVQWVLFLALAAAFLGSSWRLQVLADRDNPIPEHAPRSAAGRMFADFGVVQWGVLLIGGVTLVELLDKSIASSLVSLMIQWVILGSCAVGIYIGTWALKSRLIAERLPAELGQRRNGMARFFATWGASDWGRILVASVFLTILVLGTAAALL